MGKARILVLAEGEKREAGLVKHLLSEYGIGASYGFYAYGNNLYDLYKRIFSKKEEEFIDFLSLLKEGEKDPSKRDILSMDYSDVILVFDFDAQDPGYSPAILSSLISFFNESTENGKLYLNYPMAESFFDLKCIGDEGFPERKATRREFSKGAKYKQKVRKYTYLKTFNRYPRSRREWDWILRANIDKSRCILGQAPDGSPASQMDIFKKQNSLLEQEGYVYVLCTCLYFVYEYNSGMIGA